MKDKKFAFGQQKVKLTFAESSACRYFCSKAMKYEEAVCGNCVYFCRCENYKSADVYECRCEAVTNPAVRYIVDMNGGRKKNASE